MSLIKFEIKGIHCKSCKMLIEDVLEDLNIRIFSFRIDELKQTGYLELETDKPEMIKKAISEEGDYQVKII